MKNNISNHSAAEVFLKSWGVYEDIIFHNYMFHKEISQSVQRALSAMKSEQPLIVLDLGCGDGSMTLNLLPPTSITSYLGCDLSKPALDIAIKKAEDLKVNAKFVCDDMLNVVAETQAGSVDLVLSSYAIHHLNAQKKEQLIEGISRALAADGLFVLIDIFREPTEDRASYMRNYLSHLKQSWVNLSPEAQELVINHASEFDFPEQPSFYQLKCAQQHMPKNNQLAKYTWHEAWMFWR